MERLASRPSPTTLYEAPSHFWYRFSCFSAGAFCVVFALVNYMHIYPSPPPGLPWWVVPAYGMILVVMIGMGGYFILGVRGVVRAVRAVPSSQAEKLAGKVVREQAAATPLLLEIELSSAVPFMPSRKRYVVPSDVVMPVRLSTAVYADRPLSRRDQVAQRLADADRLKKKREYDREHLLTAPFRDFGDSFGTAWSGLRRAFLPARLCQVLRQGPPVQTGRVRRLGT